MKIRSEHMWSLINPRPVLVYLKEHDNYIVYWNGVVMTRSMALCIAATSFGIYATPEMKAAMQREYNKLYYAGAFGRHDWDKIVSSQETYMYLKRITTKHLTRLLNNNSFSKLEILQWFSYSNATRLDSPDPLLQSV
jgi:hypothetical protein